MDTQIFINLPVRDLPKSLNFFRALGFSHNPQFTDHTAACVVISPTIHVMLLTEDKFCEFAPAAICDTEQANEALICLSCESREKVDALVQLAVQAGGSSYAPAKDHGFMYQHGFQDPDKHVWELIYMAPCPGEAQP
ncbi:MAG TPA: VOC family protein [Chthoniobacterales bacterium]